MVVVGIGVRPNVGWLDGSGLDLSDGVLADAACVAAPGVVVAGDIARWPHQGYGEVMRVEHWDHAIAQGVHAAESLLAGDGAQPFTPVPWFWSDQYDRKIMLAGRTAGADEVRIVDGSLEERRFVALYRKGDRVAAALGHEPARAAGPLAAAAGRRRGVGRRHRRAGRRVTTLAWVLLVAAAVPAVVNWWAVDREQRAVIYVVKPLTMVLLIGAALALEPTDDAVRAWFVAALVLSLAGDVFLMLPEGVRLPVDPFLAGLGSFLLGHVAYVVGMAIDHRSWAMTIVGLVLVGAGVGAVAPRVLAGVGKEAPAMRVPVMAYMAVISTMGVAAFGRTVVVGIVGALLFLASDSILAINRFVQPSRGLRVAVMVTYHLAQAALVLSLLG